ncbi:MAG: molybdate ABC transporter substrate-binding protein [Methanoregula sp.]|nr:molybdate ABC transporter substrate-binding protein [Methanoregula sp.]
MSVMKNIRYSLVFTVLILCALLAAGCTSSPATGTQGTPIPSAVNTPAPSQDSLLVYSGAGLKSTMEDVGKAFTEKYGISIQYNYGGSGTLITQMNLTQKGDVFIPGSTVEYSTAKTQGLVGDYMMVAYHVPVIAVQKGNPKGITTIRDFAYPGLKVALGDTNATAIGKAGAKMFKNFNITAAVEKNVVTRTPTINELVVIMNTGQADVSLLTLDQINKETMDAITIPARDNVVLIVPIGVTTFTKNQENAQKFADFVASDEGKAIFVRHGFPGYPDAAYADVKP